MGKSNSFIMRLFLALLLAALSFFPTACKKKNVKHINVLCWSEYLPDEVLDGFENKSGVKVILTTYTTALEGERLALTGNFDIAINPNAENLVKAGIAEKMDISKLTNYNSLRKEFKEANKDVYYLPFMGASTIIVYDSTIVKTPPSSYQDLLRPDFKKQIVAIEDEWALLAIALIAQGFNIDDRSGLALGKAEEYLKKLKPNIVSFSDTPYKPIMDGSASVGLIYSADAVLTMERDPNIKWVQPKEGLYFDFDLITIIKGGDSENAHLFVNYLIEPTVTALIASTYPYVIPNAGAERFLPEKHLRNPLINVPEGIRIDKANMPRVHTELTTRIFAELTQ